MHEDEAGVTERGIVEHRLEQERLGAARVVVPAEAVEHVDLHGQFEAAGLGRHLPEQVVLERAILHECGCATSGVARVDA